MSYIYTVLPPILLLIATSYLSALRPLYMKIAIDESMKPGIAADGSHVSHGVAARKGIMRVPEE